MTIAPASHPADHDETQAAVRSRYADLARAAQAGETVQDCDPGAFTAGSFGPAGCLAGALSAAGYEAALTAAGFAAITITPAQRVSDGLHSALVRATRPLTAP